MFGLVHHTILGGKVVVDAFTQNPVLVIHTLCFSNCWNDDFSQLRVIFSPLLISFGSLEWGKYCNYLNRTVEN